MSVLWTEAAGDVEVSDIEAFTRSLNWAEAVRVIRNVNAGTRVMFSKKVYSDIRSHLDKEKYELGGLLFGRVFRSHCDLGEEYPFLTIIEESIPSQEYDNSSVSLRMGTEIWSRAEVVFSQGKMVVGWYHSHPNLGVFFSGVDRATQRSFFNQHYSLGLVIDPVRNEEKLFFGRDSAELKMSCALKY